MVQYCNTRSARGLHAQSLTRTDSSSRTVYMAARGYPALQGAHHDRVGILAESSPDRLGNLAVVTMSCKQP